MRLFLRTFQHRDIMEISKIDVMYHDESWTPEQWKKKRVIVATLVNKVVGFASFEVEKQDNGDTWLSIGKIAVLEQYRRKGVATHLVAHLTRTNPKANVITCFANETQVGGMKFLFTLGMKLVKGFHDRPAACGATESMYLFSASINP